MYIIIAPDVKLKSDFLCVALKIYLKFLLIT